MAHSLSFLLSSEARFKHPINIDRSSFKFGIIEVINRFKVVKKHNLSKKVFFIVLFFRAFFSFLKSLTFNIKYHVILYESQYNIANDIYWL